MVVSDLRWRAGCHPNDNPAADIFLESTMLGEHNRARTVSALARQWHGNSRHLWMYDFHSMKQRLEDAGFVDVRRCTFGDWSDPMFGRVESRDRLEDNRYQELAIECKRPAKMKESDNAAEGPGIRS